MCLQTAFRAQLLDFGLLVLKNTFRSNGNGSAFTRITHTVEEGAFQLPDASRIGQQQRQQQSDYISLIVSLIDGIRISIILDLIPNLLQLP